LGGLKDYHQSGRSTFIFIIDNARRECQGDRRLSSSDLGAIALVLVGAITSALYIAFHKAIVIGPCYNYISKSGSNTMLIAIDDDIFQASGMSEAEFTLEIIIMLFPKKKISIGKAAHLARMHLLQFQHELASRKIPVHYDADRGTRRVRT